MKAVSKTSILADKVRDTLGQVFPKPVLKHLSEYVLVISGVTTNGCGFQIKYNLNQ